VVVGIFAVVSIFAGVIAPYDPNAIQFEPILGPSRAHLLGTTGNGQDIFSQLVWGTRQSLFLALVAGLMATVIAVVVGVSAAYLGGLWDHVLNLFTDVFLVIPTLPLMIVVAAYAKGGGILVLIAVIVITGWSYGARQLRSQALSLRNREFLEAARARGERSFYIIVFEILPNMTSLIVAIFLGAALYAVLAAAGLQFIGLGDSNDLSWGTMLHWAQNNGALLAGSPLWVLAPGFCIAALGAAFALLNYAFDEIGNPALRPVRRTRT
jgi:peptide/nickel transport system permease protein